MSPVLACDTSSATLYVAVTDAAGRVFQRDYDPGPGGVRTERIGSVVQELCAVANIKLTEIKGLVIGAGPGSFTGLRIGSAFIKGLAWSLKIPVQQVNSLRAFAESFFLSDLVCNKVAVLQDAGRSELFAARYSRCADGIVEELVPSIQPSESFIEQSISSGYKLVGFSHERGELVSAPSGVANALIRLAAAESRTVNYNLLELAYQEPLYLRAVSARTIAERVSNKFA